MLKAVSTVSCAIGVVLVLVRVYVPVFVETILTHPCNGVSTIAWETSCYSTYNSIVSACKKLDIPPPQRPEPIYSFFPIYSPFQFKVNDDAGFYIGPDNRIKSMYIQDGALRFELEAILRPGRFLGNHYLAFSVPQRTFIITMDRVKSAIRSARKHKRDMAKLKEEAMKLSRITMQDGGKTIRVELPPELTTAQLASIPDSDLRFTDEIDGSDGASTSGRTDTANGGRGKESNKNRKGKSLFTRFVEGYNQIRTQEEEENVRMTMAISEWFGKQRKALNENEAREDKTTNDDTEK